MARPVESHAGNVRIVLRLRLSQSTFGHSDAPAHYLAVGQQLELSVGHRSDPNHGVGLVMSQNFGGMTSKRTERAC